MSHGLGKPQPSADFGICRALHANVTRTVETQSDGSLHFAAGIELVVVAQIEPMEVGIEQRITIGRVTDFLLFHYAGWSWPAFNVADSAITVGAALLIVDSFRSGRRDAAPAPTSDPR